MMGSLVLPTGFWSVAQDPFWESCKVKTIFSCVDTYIAGEKAMAGKTTSGLA